MRVIPSAYSSAIALIARQENGRYYSALSVRHKVKKTKAERLASASTPSATLLLDRGAGIKTVQLRMGHKSVAATYDNYIHATARMDALTRGIADSLLPTASPERGQKAG